MKEGYRAHAYIFTSGKIKGKEWGGTATTPAAKAEIFSLRAEHGGGGQLECY